MQIDDLVDPKNMEYNCIREYGLSELWVMRESTVFAKKCLELVHL